MQCRRFVRGRSADWKSGWRVTPVAAHFKVFTDGHCRSDCPLHQLLNPLILRNCLVCKERSGCDHGDSELTMLPGVAGGRPGGPCFHLHQPPRTCLAVVIGQGSATGPRQHRPDRRNPVAFPQNIDPIQFVAKSRRSSQSGAADPQLARVLQQVASDCPHQSFNGAQKTALPPGWLGRRPASAREQRRRRQMRWHCCRGAIAEARTHVSASLARTFWAPFKRRWRGLVCMRW